MKSNILWIIPVLALFFSCNNDIISTDPDDTTDTLSTDSSSYKIINNWILEEMQTYYLWEDKLPDVTGYASTYPEDFYESLLYTDKDKWSWITNDYSALASDLEGTPTSMGYSPAFYLYNSSQNVLIVVEYVYPNSPAEIAGLKRGDIILTIDGQLMDKDNYYDLYSGSSYTVELGAVQDGSLANSGTQITMTATEIEADPSIYHTIIESEGIKIGYLVYTEFVAGTDDKYLSTLNNICDEFHSAGITNLIVDLRYNPGGDIDCAGYLASAIAPNSAVNGKKTLVKMSYNDLLDSYFTQYEGQNSENLVYRFPSNHHNMNLSTVYFLTTSGTASASELLISGLQPYMNTVIVGEPTYGKYTGAYVIHDLNTPRQHNWAIVPIVLEYANADGYTDFADGLSPDIEIEDDLVNAVPFGDTTDAVLAKAIEAITGETTTASKSVKLQGNYQRVRPTQEAIRKNLWMKKGSSRNSGEGSNIGKNKPEGL